MYIIIHKLLLQALFKKNFRKVEAVVKKPDRRIQKKQKKCYSKQFERTTVRK